MKAGRALLALCLLAGPALADEPAPLAQSPLPVSRPLPRLGEPAPDFLLPDVSGKPVRLSELAGIVRVLVFLRGDYDPPSLAAMRALAGAGDEIAATGARLMVLAPETPEAGNATMMRVMPPWPLLLDTGNFAARAFGLTRPQDAADIKHLGQAIPEFNGMMQDEYFGTIPMDRPEYAAIIIDAEGRIAWLAVGQPPGPGMILEALAGLAAPPPPQGEQ